MLAPLPGHTVFELGAMAKDRERGAQQQSSEEDAVCPLIMKTETTDHEHAERDSEKHQRERERDQVYRADPHIGERDSKECRAGRSRYATKHRGLSRGTRVAGGLTL